MLLDCIFHNLHYENVINVFFLRMKLCSSLEYTFSHSPLPSPTPQGFWELMEIPVHPPRDTPSPTPNLVHEDKLIEAA